MTERESEKRSSVLEGQETERQKIGLSAYEKVLLARHPDRPYTLDYIGALFEDFIELKGDRLYGEDGAIVGGLAWLNGKPVVVVGHQKGRDPQERVQRNFGMPHPEGYRKALRLMNLAEKWRRPLISFVDTPGAGCLDEDEQRNICGALAQCQAFAASMTVPTVAIIIGEGGSGGAIALAVANKVLMMENATYSVIQPESCAAIIWRDQKEGPRAAEALRLTAQDALALGVVDAIIPEPPDGAHSDPNLAFLLVKNALLTTLAELEQFSPLQLKQQRYEKFRKMGVWQEEEIKADALPKP
ncbi:MAG: acetyl-CoA carboxylase carboxyltransferase subunit alpha [Armatimonadota bacterium]|nr:acetyl-CoA carboxylase carboxyltransferase subunit alpha [Armatimonadota bacterium]